MLRQRSLEASSSTLLPHQYFVLKLSKSNLTYTWYIYVISIIFENMISFIGDTNARWETVMRKKKKSLDRIQNSHVLFINTN